MCQEIQRYAHISENGQKVRLRVGKAPKVVQQAVNEQRVWSRVLSDQRVEINLEAIKEQKLVDVDLNLKASKIE